MSDSVIQVDKLSKQYRLGTIGGKRLADDLNRWWAKLRGKEDPLSKVGQSQTSGFKSYPSPSSPQLSKSSPQPSDTLWALKDVSFEVKRGEVLGIIGRNGAGKSTLLKILSRVTAPTSGEVRVKGRIASLLEVGTGFHPELTGRENIFLNGAILGMSRAEIQRKFDEIVAFAETDKFIDTPVKRYSSGMYVRLAFAVAAHLEPEILIVDEVLAVGDTHFQKKCLGKMQDVAKQGRTILFVSHNMAAIEHLCDCAILLSNGKTICIGGVSRAIKHYLHFERPSKLSSEALAADKTGTIRLMAVHPLDGHLKPIAAVQCGGELMLAIEINSTVPLSKLTLSVGINTPHDMRVAVLHSEITGKQLEFSAGTHVVTCRIMHLPLAPGPYLLDIKIITGSTVAIWAPRVEQLCVESGDFYNTGKLPDVSWGGHFYVEQQWAILNVSGAV